MRASLNPRVLAAALFASFLLLVSGQEARAGRLHPELEAQLTALPAGGTLPVIVEMYAQADPHAAAQTAPHGQRRLRLQAVVDALRDTATQHQGPVRALLAHEQALGNVRRVVPFWVFNGLAVTATEPVIRRLAARADVWEVRPDAEIPPPPEIQPTATPGTSASVSVWNLDRVRAPEVWALNPDYTGTGQVVGSFDTGVDITHPDLQPRYRGNHAISWFDPYGEHATPFDFNGHGTHTTGTAVGGAESGKNIGVAPGARWIAAKAWNDSNVGLASAFHAIFQWFLAPGGDSANAPDVVNGSWGFAAPGCFAEFQADILAFRAAGIFPSFAAGNNGPAGASVRSPGAGPEAFAAGATDANDNIASFSARGPSPCGGVKPDLSAPGVGIVSAVPGGYVSADGTSMAAPHVSGSVAVLRSINPAVTVDELETVLTLGAVDLGVPGADDTFGAGRLDLFQSAQILLGGIKVVSIAATNAMISEAGPPTAAFTVLRMGSTAVPLTVQYTVAGTATAGSDYVALPTSVTIPAGSATATIVVAPIDDTLVEPNETVIVTLVPDPAYIVGTPSSATATIVSDEPTPDLIVSTLAAPSTVGMPAGFTVTETVKNQGAAAADATTLRFYLSTDPVLDAGDTVLGSRIVPTLAAGASSSGSTTLNIPSSRPAGTYYLIARADADDAVVESDEGNNTKVVQIQVLVDVVVAPSTIDLATPPATFTMTGSGFGNVGFGLPVVNFVRNGTLVAQARATALAGTTSLTVPYPTAATSISGLLPGFSVGAVDAQVWLQTGPGSFSLLGSGPLTVTDTRPAPPTPSVDAIVPSTVDLAAPPATFTVTGNAFANVGYGLPVVNFVRSGTLLAQARATALAGTTTLTVPFPTAATALSANLPGLSPGTVQAQVYSQTGLGGFTLLGSVTLTVTDTRPPGVDAITPSTVDLAAPPGAFTITGRGFASGSFGLPVVSFVRNGTVLAQARATALSGTTSLTVPFPTAATALLPNLPGLSAGTVEAQVSAQTGSGTFTLIGSVTLTVTDTRPVSGVDTITPNPVDLATPPAAFTVTGNGFANVGFGLPVVNFVRSGALIAQARATAVTGTTTLTVPFPTAATALSANLPGLSAGTVQAQVYSQTGLGSFTLLGSVALTVTDNRPPSVDAITPSTVDLAAPPANFTITGSGLANVGFGLPVVNFVRNGTVLAQVRASVLTGTTTLTVPFPTAGLSVGPVQAQVYAQTSSTGLTLIGSVALTVTDTRPVASVDTITPNPVDLATAPAAFTIGGNGFANLGFGLPVVNFLRNGALIAQARATAVGGTTTLTVPFPTAATALSANLPGLSPGTVQAQVWSQTGLGSFTLLGSVTLTVVDNRPPSVDAITPSTVDLASPPASFTITGSGFANVGFGLPVVNFVRNGTLLVQVRATALSGTTTLTVPFPSTGLSAGSAQAQVYSQTSSTGLTLIGSVALTITDTRPVSGVNAITPNPVDLAAPPGTFTITGNGFANVGFGLPVINFVRNGALVAQARATAVTGTTTLTLPFPTAATALSANLPGLSPGTVQAQVWAQTGLGSFTLIGSVTLTVTDTRPAPSVDAITPSTVDLASPPATFTITGNGFASVGFGLPVVNFVRNGTLLAQVRATAVAGSTTLTVPFPPAGLSAGAVQAQVYSQTSSATLTLIGSIALTVTDTRPAPSVDAITPNTIDLAAPPATFTITGNGFANVGFGLPVVNFTRNGSLLAQARATAVAGSTTLTVPFPTAATALSANLPGLSPGTVQAQVWAQTGPGSFALIGSVTLTVQSPAP